MRLNTNSVSFLKKQLISHIREGDFLHPGEIEAIEIVAKYITRNPTNRLLDAGCGLGGTAKYLKDHGFGIPVGVDINNKAITYAQSKYPDIEFHCCDIVDSQSVLQTGFDFVYLFSSFLNFQNQPDSLQTLSKLAKENALLILFDYTLSEKFSSKLSWVAKKYTPIDASIKSMLSESGWNFVDFVDLTPNFCAWYQQLADKIESQKHDIINKFGQYAYNAVFANYSIFNELYKEVILGGGIIIAQKK